MPKVTKAVIPVAGLGTRMLPAIKAISKEMLNLGHVPPGAGDETQLTEVIFDLTKQEPVSAFYMTE